MTLQLGIQICQRVIEPGFGRPAGMFCFIQNIQIKAWPLLAGMIKGGVVYQAQIIAKPVQNSHKINPLKG